MSASAFRWIGGSWLHFLSGIFCFITGFDVGNAIFDWWEVGFMRYLSIFFLSGMNCIRFGMVLLSLLLMQSFKFD